MVSAAKLEVTIRDMAEGIVIEAVGDLDLTTVKTFEVPLKDSIQATISATKSASLSVDLRRVDFIDSAGLALLVAARKRLAPAQRALQVLLMPGRQPERVLKLGRFDMIMTLKYYDAEVGEQSVML